MRVVYVKLGKTNLFANRYFTKNLTHVDCEQLLAGR